MLPSLDLSSGLQNLIVAPLQRLYTCPGISLLLVTGSLFGVKGPLYIFFSSCRSAMGVVALAVAFSRSSRIYCLLGVPPLCEVPMFRYS